MENTPRYWFPAKRYGWGWGPPAMWQGWVVLLVWMAALGVGAALIVPHGMWLYVVFLLAMSGVLIAICYAKGEPPRWRWGEK